MSAKFEKLNAFFEKIKTISFWQRIFGWRQVNALSYDAYQEFKDLLGSFDNGIAEIERLKGSAAILANDNQHLKEKENELTLLKERLNQLAGELSLIKQENTAHKQSEADRKDRYEKDAATLTTLTNQVQSERQKEVTARQEAEIARLAAMKQTWSNHQENVRNTIKSICQKHTIEYLDKVPFKGSPDNTIKICEEFVIFDAKSPSSDDLRNFPLYIKAQTESVKKYIKEENVRKDVFLVVPSNAVEVIEAFSYNMADYRVYVVTIDVLEPLMLSLKKIEDYEYVNQLSPEERENICRVIGKFAHMTKRRIQIDQFFTRQFLEILTKCESELPADILDKAVEFEQSEKMNPPQEKRAKQILTKHLENEAGKIEKEVGAKGIVFPASLQNLRSLPLEEEKPIS